MAVVAVTTPAPRRSLTTTERYRILMGATPSGVAPTRLEALLGQATSLIEDWCGRVFARERVTEAVYGAQLSALVLERAPVLAVHGVTIDGVALDPSRYEIEDPAAGIVRLKTSARFAMLDELECQELSYSERIRARRDVRHEIDYTGGYVPYGWPTTDPPTPVTLPQALELACIEAVQNLLLGGGAKAGVQSERLGDASWTYTETRGFAIGGQVPALLERYRRVAL